MFFLFKHSAQITVSSMIPVRIVPNKTRLLARKKSDKINNYVLSCILCI